MQSDPSTCALCTHDFRVFVLYSFPCLRDDNTRLLNSFDHTFFLSFVVSSFLFFFSLAIVVVVPTVELSRDCDEKQEISSNNYS